MADAGDALVPYTDKPGDTPETMARRARIQARAADERARRALIVADDVRKDSWTKEQHRRFARELTESWARYKRVIITLIGACLILTLVGFYVLWAIVNGADGRAASTQQRLDQLTALATEHCEARNAQRDTSELLYQGLLEALEAERPDSPQIPVLRAALEQLPEPQNCGRYSQITYTTAETALG